MSKKPKTPDVAAVWEEVKGISNGLAALRVTVAVTGNDVKRLESERLMANRFASGLSDSLEKHAEQIGKHNAWLASLQASEIDAQGIGEQIGDLEVKVENLQPLHAAVSMLEAKTGNNRIEIEAILKRLDGAFRAIGRVEERLDVIGPQVRSQSERMRCQHDGMVQELQSSRISVLSRKLDTLRSIVTVLVIVQAFTTIAGLAWVLGGGW